MSLSQIAQYFHDALEQVDHKLQHIRKSAFQRCSELPLPDRRVERWRYSPVNDWWKWYPVANLPEKSPQKTDSHSIIFVNGYYQESVLPPGVSIELIPPVGSLFEDYMEALHASFQAPMYHITIQESLAEPLCWKWLQSAEKMSYPKVQVSIAPHVNVLVKQTLCSRAAGASYAKVNWQIGENACLNLIDAQQLHEDFRALQMNRFELFAESQLRVSSVQQGQGVSVMINHVILTQEGGEANLQALSVMEKRGIALHEAILEHGVGKTTSQMEHRLLGRESTNQTGRGIIHIHPQAQKVDASYQVKGLLCSERAEINARPELFILADDVKAAHGCAIGGLDEEALFYLRSRGLDEQEAKDLLAHAFVDVLWPKELDKG